jgi:hypothetical protein
MSNRRFPVLFLFVFLSLPLVTSAQVAPDASGSGPFATTSSEYKLPASVDPDVSTELATELWARVYHPTPLGTGPYPLLVFLHGNHATCGRDQGIGPGRFDINVQYTFTGTCPDGYVPVPSHAGYAYLADRLASWGYIVVSINANRGVNAAPGVTGDRGLNLRRGRLVLKHLQKLSEWNTHAATTPPSLGFDLFGKLDFAHVGLLGHSRGGEGMRAAYNLFRDAGSPWPARIGAVGFEGIFEIGPVDGQTGRVLNADGTAWNVLLPMCDGDVFNLQGVRPFDRMLLIRSETVPLQKSTYTVWGTNHNFYNTEWQLSDSAGCLGHKRLFPNLLGSAQQRVPAISSVLAFFRGHVGSAADPGFNANFDPEFALPSTVTDVTRVDRGFDVPGFAFTTTFDDFDQASGTNSYGSPNDASRVSVAHGGIWDHSTVQRVAQIEWDNASAATFFQSNWTPPLTSRDASGFRTLEFRVSRQCGDAVCRNPGSQFHFTVNFSISLVAADGTVSAPVQLGDYLTLTGPVGGLVRGAGASPHPILQTVRIPLSSFTGIQLANLRGVRFTFDDTNHDEIFIGNIRLSTLGGGGALTALSLAAGEDDPLDTQDPAASDVNKVASIRRSVSAQQDAGIEIELTSNREFLPRGELLVLRIGEQEFDLSRYRSDGDTRSVIFTLTADQFARLSSGDAISVQYGDGADGRGWNFGPVDKNMLK